MINVRCAILAIYCLTVLFAAAGMSACGNAERSEAEIMHAAGQYIDQHNLLAAAIELKNLLQKHPENGEARYLLGSIYLRLGDFLSAEKELRRAVETGWNPAQTKIKLAEAYLIQGKFAALLDSILPEDNESPETRAGILALRAAATANSNRPEADTLLQQAETLDANALHVLRTRAGFMIADGDFSGALAVLQRALAEYPDNQELLLWQARLLVHEGDIQSARSSYQALIDLDSSGVVTMNGRQARLGLADLLIDLKHYAVAESLLRPLYRQNSKDVEANFLGAVLAFKKHDFQRAEVQLRKVLAQDANHRSSQFLLGSINYSKGDLEQAIYYLSKYTEAVPYNPTARKLLARAYMKLGQPAASRNLLEPFLEASEDAELLALVGMSEIRSGEQVAGIRRLEKAVNANPDNVSLREELAKAYIETGDVDRALDVLSNLLRNGENTASAEGLIVLAHIRNGNYARAVESVRALLEKRPDDMAIATLAGHVYAMAGKEQEARKQFNRVLASKPDSLYAAMALARLEINSGNLDSARKIYQASAKLSSMSIAPYLALAALAEKEGDEAAMIQWLERAQQRRPEAIDTRLMLARYYFRTGQIDKADVIASEANGIEPDNADIAVMRARIATARGNHNKAQAFLQKALAISPDSVYLRTLLAESLLIQGESGKAGDEIEEVLRQQADYAPALMLEAQLKLRQYQYEQAYKIIRRIRKTGATGALIDDLEAQSLLGRQDYAQAGKILEAVYSKAPSQQRVIWLSEAYGKLGRYQEAADLLKHWLAQYPDDFRVRERLGILYQSVGKDGDAVRQYEQVVEADPKNRIVLNNLAWLYHLAADDRALGLAKRAYQEDPDDPGILDTYGWILLKAGRVDEGAAMLEQAFKQLPSVPEVRYHYAMALDQSGHTEQATRMLRKLLREEKSFAGREAAMRFLNGG